MSSCAAQHWWKEVIVSYSLYQSRSSIASAGGQTATCLQHVLPYIGEGDPFALCLAHRALIRAPLLSQREQSRLLRS